MATQSLQTNTPTVLPTSLNIALVGSNGRQHLELDAHWDRSTMSCGDPRQLSGKVVLEEGYPAVIDVVHQDSMLQTAMPSRLSYPMLSGLIDVLREKLEAHTSDPSSVLKSIVFASQTCPALRTSSPGFTEVSVVFSAR